MKKAIKHLSCLLLIAASLTTASAQKTKTLDVKYLKEGKVVSERITIDFITEKGEIKSPYYEQVSFMYIDSVRLIDNDPDKDERFTTPHKLDFTKEIAPYSPEYYTASTIYYTSKSMDYYNGLFGGKIDFISQTNTFGNNYRLLDIAIGDLTLISTPKMYIFKEGGDISPSIYNHEIGHRAFWYIESGLGVKFKGLSYLHMGLLEYFTVSLNNSPLVGEDDLGKLVRDASKVYGYPFHDSLKVEQTMKLIKESYVSELKDSNNIVAQYINATSTAYQPYFHVYDNHRQGMVITSTLWRVRQQLGQEITDRLIAEAILSLNDSMELRATFYQPDTDEKLAAKLEWYDLYYTLQLKDKELNGGKGADVIKASFAKTGFPVSKVSI